MWSLKLEIQDIKNEVRWGLYALLNCTHSGGAGSILSSANKPLKTLSQYRLPHCRTCCLLLFNDLESPIYDHHRSVSTHLSYTLRHALAESLYSIYILYQLRIFHCDPRRYPTVESRQLQLPRHYALGLLQRIRGTASSLIHSEKWDHSLKATSLERGESGT